MLTLVFQVGLCGHKPRDHQCDYIYSCGGTSVLNLKAIHPKVVETFHKKIKKCQCATGVGQKAKIIRINPVGNINGCTNFHGIHPIVIYIYSLDSLDQCAGPTSSPTLPSLYPRMNLTKKCMHAWVCVFRHLCSSKGS